MKGRIPSADLGSISVSYSFRLSQYREPLEFYPLRHCRITVHIIRRRGNLFNVNININMGKGEMDEAAAERIRKARGGKVSIIRCCPEDRPLTCVQDDFARRAYIAARRNKGSSDPSKGGSQGGGNSSGGKQSGGGSSGGYAK